MRSLHGSTLKQHCDQFTPLNQLRCQRYRGEQPLLANMVAVYLLEYRTPESFPVSLFIPLELTAPRLELPSPRTIPLTKQRQSLTMERLVVDLRFQKQCPPFSQAIMDAQDGIKIDFTDTIPPPHPKHQFIKRNLQQLPSYSPIPHVQYATQ